MPDVRGEEVIWEFGAPGWPPLSRWAVGLGALVAAAALLSARAETLLIYPAWGVPALLPVALALLSVGVYWLARWRSTSWTLTPAGLVRTRGVFLRRPGAPLAAARVTAADFAGLSGESAAALAEAARTGVPPAIAIAGRGSPRPFVVLLAVSALQVVAVEAAAWRHRRLRADFLRLAAAVERALDRAGAEVAPALAAEYARRIEQDRALGAIMRRQALEQSPAIYGGVQSYLLSDVSLMHGNRLELRFELRAPRVTPSTLTLDDVRVRLALRCDRPGWLPRAMGPLVIVPGSAPDDERFLQVLLARLEAEGVTYELRRED